MVKDELNSSRLSLSFEFFPPKNPDLLNSFYQTVNVLKKFNPVYMSVTYGALGSNQDQTLDIVSHLQGELGVAAMSHLTCIGSTKQFILDYIDALDRGGVTNVLALRGDIPKNVNRDEVLTDFCFASELVSFLKTHKPHFTVGVAGYPEKHPEARSLEEDIVHLKHKVDQGADFVVTQLFFDAELFLRFREKAVAAGISVPIVPGIMPVTNYRMIERITQMCGVFVPDKIVSFFQKDVGAEDTHRFAVDYTLSQCEMLKREGVSGLHFYTLNQATVVEDVCQGVMGL